MPGRAGAGLVVIDVQPGLLKAYPPRRARRVVESAAGALDLLAPLGLPTLILELDPDRLGPTHGRVLGAAPGARVVAKARYDATADPESFQALEDLDRPWLVLLGVETHVCVLQTAVGLLGRGRTVAFLDDAVFSRTPRDQRVGRELLVRAGAVPLTTEVLLFALLGGRDHPAFSQVLPRLKARVSRPDDGEAPIDPGGPYDGEG
ncbi:isochorismatase family protein [Deferrisoma camini]|uniref:isochorismatase family protein n=1 Tax=Deferrisoma camini TaxID=1035120 RepID=UPI0004B56462|nr:isochorismatase family protein [Deferrisoma camini]